jgi:hypothetical protein
VKILRAKHLSFLVVDAGELAKILLQNQIWILLDEPKSHGY